MSGKFGNITNITKTKFSYNQNGLYIEVIISSDLFWYVILLYITKNTYTSYSVYLCTII